MFYLFFRKKFHVRSFLTWGCQGPTRYPLVYTHVVDINKKNSQLILSRCSFNSSTEIFYQVKVLITNIWILLLDFYFFEKLNQTNYVRFFMKLNEIKLLISKFIFTHINRLSLKTQKPMSNFLLDTEIKRKINFQTTYN